MCGWMPCYGKGVAGEWVSVNMTSVWLSIGAVTMLAGAVVWTLEPSVSSRTFRAVLVAFLVALSASVIKMFVQQDSATSQNAKILPTFIASKYGAVCGSLNVLLPADATVHPGVMLTNVPVVWCDGEPRQLCTIVAAVTPDESMLFCDGKEVPSVTSER